MIVDKLQPFHYTLQQPRCVFAKLNCPKLLHQSDGPVPGTDLRSVCRQMQVWGPSMLPTLGSSSLKVSET